MPSGAGLHRIESFFCGRCTMSDDYRECVVRAGGALLLKGDKKNGGLSERAIHHLGRNIQLGKRFLLNKKGPLVGGQRKRKLGTFYTLP